MRVLCLGDVVGDGGMDALRRRLPALRRELGVDLCFVNGENADAGGAGMPPDRARELLALGADAVTAGNHALRRCGADLYADNPAVLCPQNAFWAQEGWGVYLHDAGPWQAALLCLSGAAFTGPVNNPFDAMDAFFAGPARGCRYKIIEVHGESTAEKQALAYYADGRAGAVFGTHTHVQTADGGLLPGKTGYITDIGMTGPVHSVIGVEPALAVEKQRTQRPVHFRPAGGPCGIQGVLFELDDKTGLCLSVRPVKEVLP